ncbi:hypothetical protein [Pusillimonas sp. ANT_WB101]|uniref:hypothetical protein n=1 Tax=Pusillimonas sp. ANT_WB101 TaxID=2597356 RepID=UPI0011F05099|nr:hypothetical protein [Pusillimonas sp. ANT_WB101]KAA0890238.1 hypothetical protein FQ179_18120 [Pusillimonas sp. ANT_WB101]
MKPNRHISDRSVQIELVRARAALERQSVVHAVRNLSASMKPRAIARSAFPQLTGRSLAGWALQAVALTRRYPLLASTASAALSGLSRRSRWWRIGAGLLLSWQVARTMSGKHDD